MANPTGNIDTGPDQPQDQSADRRVRKTQKALAAALMGLLQDSDWAQISVAAICERADVARSTFYAHFDNKGALLDHAFSSTTIAVRGQFSAAPDGGLATIDWLVEHLSENRALVARIGLVGAGKGVFARFQTTIASVLKEELALRGRHVSEDETVFAIAGCLAILQRHAIRGDFPASLSPRLSDLVLKTVSPVQK